ncbi:MAG TPA: hypothetical protein VJN21_13610 [Candidatus Acidoferrales bacterium]|nr:hypothetical protein [Candidatus Acidoferrales bacterium]
MRICKVCGAQVKRNFPTHAQGVRHRYAKTLTRWIADDTISFAEMSRRLKVSRERVRQLAEQLPKAETGRARQRKAALIRAREALLRADTPGARVVQELEERGIAWEPVQLHDSYDFSEKLIRIGSPPRLTCSLQRFGKKLEGYYNINKATSRPCDFYLFAGPAGVLIFPPEARPRGQTTFLLNEERKAKGVPRARHDWKDYLNAWHLVEDKLKTSK